MTGTDGSLPDACTAALTNGAKWGIFLKAPVEGIEKGILWDIGAAMIWSGIEVVITGLTRNQFDGNVTWVRIPPAPPQTPESTTFSGVFSILPWCLLLPFPAEWCPWCLDLWCPTSLYEKIVIRNIH